MLSTWRTRCHSPADVIIKATLRTSFFNGLLYCALDPHYARQPLSGEGGAGYGGQLNAKDTPGFYISLAPAAAIGKANHVGTLHPTVLVTYIADFTNVLDATELQTLAAFKMTAATLPIP